MKQQLKCANSAGEVAVILKDCFAAQLELMLHLPPHTINRESPIIELGVDSLVAVVSIYFPLETLRTQSPILKAPMTISLHSIEANIKKGNPLLVLTRSEQRHARKFIPLTICPCLPLFMKLHLIIFQILKVLGGASLSER